MPTESQPQSDDAIYSSIGLQITAASLPALHYLSPRQISYLATRIAGQLSTTQNHDFKISSVRVELRTDFYGITISGRTVSAVLARSQSRKYWRRRIQYEADIARLNFEATLKTVGGASPDAQLYSSDITLQKARSKKSETQAFLSSKVIVNKQTGNKILLSELASQAAVNRFNELYWISKNFEAIADDNNMGWLFVTYTAPPKYHPNPLKGKCSYDPKLGVKASHTYISSAWARIRSLLNKWGIKSGVDTYFGFRIAETHKDGSVHWHLLVFTTFDATQPFIDASKEHFPHYGQLKIEIGDPKIGSASSYIFKYLAKGFEPSVSNFDTNANAKDTKADEKREQSDLASIRNGERVRAALQTMRVRQYQPFGVKNVLTLVRLINKLQEVEIHALPGEVAEIVKTKIWRNTNGLKHLLERPDLFTKQNGTAPLMLTKEEFTTIYGEKSFRVTGLKIGDNHVYTKGRFKIEEA
ncbi:replication endonuclease [Pseudomonas sp. FDAARGOS_380]|uniref:replication endonuclease n=1 Tax=Pseudomonas sp. FDAARGOS_380 TaxID=2018067 RepID=UPI0015ACE18A|nr:replication endonuclease [Pseudomonas sp. FDAARGOS_380]